MPVDTESVIESETSSIPTVTADHEEVSFFGKLKDICFLIMFTQRPNVVSEHQASYLGIVVQKKMGLGRDEYKWMNCTRTYWQQRCGVVASTLDCYS